MHQRRFAGAGGADDGDELALLDGDVDAAQRLHRVLAGVVDLGDLVELDESFACRRLRLFVLE